MALSDLTDPDHWKEGFKQTGQSMATVVDPLGIARSAGGIDATDPIGDYTQTRTNETASNAADAATDIDVNVPWEAKGVASIIALGLLAIAFGQLFNVNVGGGS